MSDGKVLQFVKPLPKPAPGTERHENTNYFIKYIPPYIYLEADPITLIFNKQQAQELATVLIELAGTRIY